MAAPIITQQDAARTLAAVRQLIQEVPTESTGALSIHFKRMGVQPPSNLYVTLDDCLAVNVLSSVANPALVVVARLLRPDGVISYNHERIGAVTANTITKFIFQLAEGFLLDVCVSAVGSSLAAGECFVRVDLQHNSQAGTSPFATLANGYVTANHTVAWPSIEPAQDVTPLAATLAVTVANPAAGAEWLYTVPAGVTAILNSVHFIFTTSAAVADRLPHLVIDDGTNTLTQKTHYTVQAAGQAGEYNFAHFGGDDAAPVGYVVFPSVPPTPVKAGYRIGTVTTAIDVLDQYSAITLCFASYATL
jgi:hypothetical protein